MGWLSNWWDNLKEDVRSLFYSASNLVSSTGEDARNNFQQMLSSYNAVGADLYKPVTETLGNIKEWVVKQIQNLVEELRVLKWKFRRKLAEWLENPIVFWLSVAGIIVVAVFVPEIVSWLQKTKLWILAKAVIDKIKTLAGKFLDKIHYVQLITVHRVMLILNPDYQAFWNDLDQAFMALAEEIELGVGTMNNLTMSVRNLYYATYSMLGIDMDTIEIKFYQDATTFWANANKRWERYVRDPQLIFLDAATELVYPVLTEQTQYGNERIQHELETAENIDKIFENVDDFRNAINDLIEALPDEIEASVLLHVGPFMDKINKAFDETINPWRKKIDESIDIIENTINEVNNAIRTNKQRERSLVDELGSILFDGSLDIASKRKIMSALFDRILKGSIETQNELDTVLLLNYTREKDDTPTTEREEKPTPYIPLIKIDMSSIYKSAENWFIGEY